MNWQWPGPAWCLYHLRGSKHPGYRKHRLGSLNPFSLSTWELANLPLTFYFNIKTIPLISRVLEDFRKQLFLWRLKREHSSSQLVFQTEINSLMPTAGPKRKRHQRPELQATSYHCRTCSSHASFSHKNWVVKNLNCTTGLLQLQNKTFLWQPAWEGGLGENGCKYMCGWVPSLFTWNCHNTVNQLCAVLCLIAQSCPTLCEPMDWSPPGSSVHGILQARILEWVAYPFSRASSQSRNQTGVSCIAGRFFTSWASREALISYGLNTK